MRASSFCDEADDEHRRDASDRGEDDDSDQNLHRARHLARDVFDDSILLQRIEAEDRTHLVQIFGGAFIAGVLRFEISITLDREIQTLCLQTVLDEALMKLIVVETITYF